MSALRRFQRFMADEDNAGVFISAGNLIKGVTACVILVEYGYIFLAMWAIILVPAANTFFWWLYHLHCVKVLGKRPA